MKLDCRALLQHLGLERYQECLVANFGTECELDKLRRSLTMRNMPHMNIKDYEHQKMIVNHLRELTGFEKRVGKDHPELKVLLESQGLAAETPRVLEAASTEPKATHTRSLTGSGVDRSMSSKLQSDSTRPAHARRESAPSVIMRTGHTISNTRPRAAITKDHNTERQLKKTWVSIQALQKEMVDDTKLKHLAKLRAGEAWTVDGPHDAPPAPISHPGPHAKNDISSGRLEADMDSIAFMPHHDEGVAELRESCKRSKGYGNCALRMSLIEKYLFGLQTRIIDQVRTSIGCDRASLMFVDFYSGELVFFAGETLIRMPMEKGIAGYTAMHGEVVNVDDAYEDPRFNRDVDKSTGYRTRSLLSFPVKQLGGERVIAVIQMLNKTGGFSSVDAGMVEACSMKVAQELEESLDVLAEAQREWGKYKLSEATKGGSKYGLGDRAVNESKSLQELLDEKMKKIQKSDRLPIIYNKSHAEEINRLKRRKEYGQLVLKNQYGLL